MRGEKRREVEIRCKEMRGEGRDERRCGKTDEMR